MPIAAIVGKTFSPSRALLAAAICGFVTAGPAAPARAASDLVQPVVAPQAGDGPFTSLSGYWAGGGTITLNTGASEKIRCKATYAVHSTGKALNQSLRCASDSYKLEISSNVVAEGGSVSGTWSEATRNVTGSISGRATSAEIRANVAGAGFSASLDLHTKGDKQIVTIRPQAGTDVTAVSITLRKG